MGAGELLGLEAEIAEVLAAENVVHPAAAMENGSTAGVLVWENSWAGPFAAAARRAGGQLVATGPVPIQAIAASIEAEQAARVKETDMPCDRLELSTAVSSTLRWPGLPRWSAPPPSCPTA